LRISGIKEESCVDGTGLRQVVFTQGCRLCCKGCHNPSTHDEQGGYIMDVRDILPGFDENPLLAGITFSGGEPFLQAEPLAWLAEQIRAREKTVFVYTGYTFEELLRLTRSGFPAGAGVERLLSLTDVLVDGPYIEELRTLDLLFRGSSNQRILDRAARARLRAAGEAPGDSFSAIPLTRGTRFFAQ
jgi:anaerobic ribonucleoside-triphosphate reductase activating protein